MGNDPYKISSKTIFYRLMPTLNAPMFLLSSLGFLCQFPNCSEHHCPIALILLILMGNDCHPLR